MTDKVPIRQLPTGVPGLDAVLGGGVPEFSFNLIAGAPGSGKTTLAQQIMFNLAEPARPALYFTVLGEPPVKMLRYQQQFTFFDAAKVNDSIRFINVAQEVLEGGLSQILKRIVQEVEAASPSIVVVDSFRSAVRKAEREPAGPLEMQHFVQQLGIHLTGWEATTFLVGEYLTAETSDNPIFTVADGLLWLYQSVDRNSVVRKMQVVKSRGHASIPGLHTFRITGDGIQVFPRVIVGPEEKPEPASPGGKRRPRQRLSTGIKPLDEMLGGGIPAGYSVLVAGPSGSGKTVLATEFLSEGVRRGEPGILAVFEKRPREYSQIGAKGKTLGRLVADQQIAIIQARPLDLSIDETLHELSKAIRSPRRAPAGDRLAVGIRARVGPHVSRGLSRIALSHGRGPHGDGRHGHDDRGGRGQLRRSALQPARDGIPDRRDHHAAVHRASGRVEAHHGRRQGARERTPEGAAGVRDHRGRHCRG